MDLSQFQPVDTTYTREAVNITRKANFELKFVKKIGKTGNIEGEFTMSSDKFRELNLDTNGLRQVNSPEGVPYLAVVANEDATLFKAQEGKNKGKKFRASVVEKALVNNGILTDALPTYSQKLKLEKVSDGGYIGKEGKGYQASALYQFVKDGEPEALTQEEAEAEVGESPSVGVYEGPTDVEVATPAPQAVVDNDDF